MTLFLLVYDRSQGRIVERSTFPPADEQRAWAERTRLILEYLGTPHVEVVLLGSASEEDLRATHGRYFETGGLALAP